ncbi:Uncharacterized protein OBRU01_20021, partial [Operophtera brumata]
RHLEAARLLLVRGCDANACDDCGYSALHLSAEHGWQTHLDCCWSEDASPTRVMTAGTARCIFPPSMGNTLCQLADTSRLLPVRGRDASACDDCGYSALHLSAEHG